MEHQSLFYTFKTEKQIHKKFSFIEESIAMKKHCDYNVFNRSYDYSIFQYFYFFSIYILFHFSFYFISPIYLIHFNFIFIMISYVITLKFSDKRPACGLEVLWLVKFYPEDSGGFIVIRCR